MAGDIIDFIGAASIGNRVYDITGSNTDSFTAGGYAAFVQAITGAQPVVLNLGNKKARIILSTTQVTLMQQYLDNQISTASKQNNALEIDLKPVIIPWALKYAIPAVIAVFAAGYLAHWGMSRI